MTRALLLVLALVVAAPAAQAGEDLPAGVCLARDPADETFLGPEETRSLAERLARLGPPCAGPLLDLVEQQPTAPTSRLAAEAFVGWGEPSLLPGLYRTFGWAMLQPIQRKEDLAFEMAAAIEALSGAEADLLEPVRDGSCGADWPDLALARYEAEWEGALADLQAPDREAVVAEAAEPFADCLAHPERAPGDPYDPLGLRAEDPVGRLGVGTRCASVAALAAWRSVGSRAWDLRINSLEGRYGLSQLHPMARELELAWGQGRRSSTTRTQPELSLPPPEPRPSRWWALLLLLPVLVLVALARIGGRARRTAFRLGAVLAGLALLVPLELVCGLAGVPPGDALRPPTQAERPREEAGDGTWLVQDQRGRVFVVPRPAGTARVAVVGASSVAGPLLTSSETIAGQLERRLAADLPCAEVLNLGHSGVASPSLRTIATEAAGPLEADLVVVYGGHNEVGDLREHPASLRRPQRLHDWRVALVRTHLYGLLSLALGRPERVPEPPRDGGEYTGWAERLDPDFERAVELRFERELVDLIRAVRRADRPLVLALPSFNHHGLQLSWWEPPRGQTRLPTPDGLATLLLGGHARGASEMARGMVEIDPDHPTPHFLLALSREAAGDLQGAEDAVQASARRNHVGSTITPGLAGILVRTAEQHDVPLADAHAALHRAAGAHLPGNDLFIDFVHLNPAGAAVVADELVATIEAAGLIDGLAARCGQ